MYTVYSISSHHRPTNFCNSSYKFKLGRPPGLKASGCQNPFSQYSSFHMFDCSRIRFIE